MMRLVVYMNYEVFFLFVAFAFTHDEGGRVGALHGIHGLVMKRT
jgi:mRNA-degrading endonuclease HigB of HigAB toxin-antitoxin module